MNRERIIEIEFDYSKKKYKNVVTSIVNKRLLKKYIKSKCEFDVVRINYNFVSEYEQMSMNREFKQHNYNTDILTFDMSNNSSELTGDVYISIKQVKKNADRYKVELFSELNRVIIHGFLHLIGYNDETKKEKREMRRLENRFIDYISSKNICSTWNGLYFH